MNLDSEAEGDPWIYYLIACMMLIQTELEAQIQSYALVWKIHRAVCWFRMQMFLYIKDRP